MSDPTVPVPEDAPAAATPEAPAVPAVVTPTQVRHSWRATARTAFQAIVALALMWGLIVQAAGLDSFAWASSTVVVAAAITKVMALPGVEAFLRIYLPFLAAAPAADATLEV